MVVNAEVFNLNQFGLEVTPGVAVPCPILLSGMGIDPKPQGESQVFGPRGQKFDSVVSPNKYWVTAAMNGAPCYTELQYPFSLIFEGSVVTIGGVSTWTFISHPGAPDAIKTLTVETGAALAGENTRFTNAALQAMALMWDRNAGVSMTGTLIGKAFEHGNSLTANPTGTALIPIVSKDVNVYMDPSAASLGSTQLLKPFHWDFQVGNKFGMEYVLKRSNGLSWDSLVELKPTLQMKLSHESDAQGLALLDTFQVGSLVFMRVEAISNLLIPATATPYSLVIDSACAVRTPDGFADVQGVHAAEFTMQGLFDAVWGNAFRITLVNGSPTL